MSDQPNIVFYVSSWKEVVGGLLFMATGFYAIVSRLWLFGELRRHLPHLSLFFATTIPYVEVEYLRHRRSIGSRKLDLIALSGILSLVLAFCLAAYLLNLSARR